MTGAPRRLPNAVQSAPQPSPVPPQSGRADLAAPSSLPTVVIHVHEGMEAYLTGTGGRPSEDYIYIGRAFWYRGKRIPASKWANPFRIGAHGHTREQVIALYERNTRLRRDLMAALPELRGKVLMCWCKPDHACHGDVLVKLLAEMDGDA